MTDVLVSVQRLCTLARVGSITITRDALARDVGGAVGDGARLLSEVMATHGLDAIDIATTITDTEFLKLAGILVGPPSTLRGAIVETAEALSIWNVRLRARGVALRPTPEGMRAVPESKREADSAAPARVQPIAPAPPASAAEAAAAADALTRAVADGDGLTVCRMLAAIEDPSAFTRAATPLALQEVVEQLGAGFMSYDDVLAILQRAGAAGARAVFEQLVAATDVAERRFLYDAAASLPATLAVARAHASDPRWYVVRNAAGLMGESRSPDAVPELSKLLRHTDHRVRIAAVVALGQIGGTAAIGRLESVLFDPSLEVRNRALTIVFASPDTEPPPHRMLMALEEDNSFEYRLEMVAALAHVHTPRARERLVKMCLDGSVMHDDLQLRLAAIDALATGHLPAAAHVLRQLADDPHAMVRQRVAAILGQR
jgi:HEAT repeat protein